MTAAGLVATGLVLVLLLARELRPAPPAGAGLRERRLTGALAAALVVWAALVGIRLGDYLG